MIDKLIIQLDKMLQTLMIEPKSNRPHPDATIPDCELSTQEQKQIIRLMRVNHCGEVCAQGLYLGQSITAQNKINQKAFEDAALEETEHLAWTKHRINQLGGQTSYLNPLFYFGSLAVGIGAGLIGDKWNLGFLEETEIQVGKHLQSHLIQLPNKDQKSQAIIKQMIIDENSHAQMAHNFGARNLPQPIKIAMKITSKIMTKATYYI